MTPIIITFCEFWFFNLNLNSLNTNNLFLGIYIANHQLTEPVVIGRNCLTGMFVKYVHWNWGNFRKPHISNFDNLLWFQFLIVQKLRLESVEIEAAWWFFKGERVSSSNSSNWYCLHNHTSHRIQEFSRYHSRPKNALLHRLKSWLDPWTLLTKKFSASWRAHCGHK